jgi:hypothetical protein
VFWSLFSCIINVFLLNSFHKYCEFIYVQNTHMNVPSIVISISLQYCIKLIFFLLSQYANFISLISFISTMHRNFSLYSGSSRKWHENFLAHFLRSLCCFNLDDQSVFLTSFSWSVYWSRFWDVALLHQVR